MNFLKFFAFFGIFSMVSSRPQSNQFASNLALQAAQNRHQAFGLSGGGSGNNANNWNAGGTLGYGRQVWSSANQRHSLGIGGAVGQNFGQTQGQPWRTRPDYGVGAGYVWRF